MSRGVINTKESLNLKALPYWVNVNILRCADSAQAVKCSDDQAAEQACSSL